MKPQPPAAIHVDLDGTRSIYNIHGWADPGGADPLYETGFANLLSFFEAEGVRATFFLIAEDLADARRRPLIEEAVRRGHAIASHSMSHPRFDGLSTERKRREVIESKEYIEAELGITVEGFRTPNFEVDRETLELVAEAGYTWDSSCFPTPAFAKRMGVDEVPITPFRPLGEDGPLEVPLPDYKPLPLPFHVSYALVLGTWYLRFGLTRFRKTGAPLTLVFHLTDLADPLPPERLPNWKAKLFTLSHRSLAGKRRACSKILSLVRDSYDL